jgi:hypothetical protein
MQDNTGIHALAQCAGITDHSIGTDGTVMKRHQPPALLVSLLGAWKYN